MIPPVVDADWVAQRADVVLADVRWYLDGRSGGAAYDAGHLPGAVFVDLDAWLAGPPSPAAGRHPLPDPEVFATGMGRLGIGDDDTVVAYDDEGGVIAARLVWLLRATGHDAALLDGGLTAWAGRLETAAPARGPRRFTARPWPENRLAAMDDAADPANVVIDARARERFLGAVEPVDPRAGHIPGARSLPTREHLDAAGRLLPADELRRRLANVGIDGTAPVVSYCGSGVTACHTLLVMEHAGLGEGRLYPGSWSQWSHDAARPVATGGGAERMSASPCVAPPRAGDPSSMGATNTIKKAAHAVGAHRITTRPSDRHVRVESGGRVLAESDRAVELDETGLPTRYYLPREDVRVDELTPSDTSSHCPFKGDATYFSAPGANDAFWVYEHPSEPDAGPIAGMLAPWPGRVDVFVDGRPA